MASGLARRLPGVRRLCGSGRRPGGRSTLIARAAPGGGEERAAEERGGASYYRGFVESPLDGSDVVGTGRDNITPTLKLAAQATAALAALTLAFLHSNGVL